MQIALLDVVRKPEKRGYWGGQGILRVITGVGNNSRDGEAVIKVKACCALEGGGAR